jgi:hypothetical protein
MSANEHEIARRRLCPDGSCTGVIGDDGRCRECGRDAAGAAPPKAPTPNAAHRPDDPGERPGAEAAVGAGEAAFDAGRKLCADGSCLGVIGPDGACNVCGQRASQ